MRSEWESRVRNAKRDSSAPEMVGAFAFQITRRSVAGDDLAPAWASAVNIDNAAIAHPGSNACLSRTRANRLPAIKMNSATTKFVINHLPRG